MIYLANSKDWFPIVSGASKQTKFLCSLPWCCSTIFGELWYMEYPSAPCILPKKHYRSEPSEGSGVGEDTRQAVETGASGLNSSRPDARILALTLAFKDRSAAQTFQFFSHELLRGSPGPLSGPKTADLQLEMRRRCWRPVMPVHDSQKPRHLGDVRGYTWDENLECTVQIQCTLL